MFDLAIVGGGVTGCSTAYFAKKAGLKVVLYEKDGIASKASGAAGAFISPRIGKGGTLQELTNEAYAYAIDFYTQNFPKQYTNTGVYRIAKDEKDAKNYPQYASTLPLKHRLTTFNDQIALFFEQGGVADATAVCNALIKGIEVVKKEVTIDEIKAKNIILATGADKSLIDLDYLGLRKTWGQRIDVKSSLSLKHNIHKNISISANIDGIVKIGATHEKEVTQIRPCSQNSTETLLKKANELLTLSDHEVVESFCGMRSSVRDFFPIAGKAVDVDKSFQKYPMIKHGIKPRNGLYYHENIYLLGGTGGRGFVFAPLLGHQLIDHIVENKPIKESLNPDRLFYKWARKLNQKTN